MLPYYLLIFIPFILLLISETGVRFKKCEEGILTNDARHKSRDKIIGVFFFVLFLILALRATEIGVDIENYKRVFNNSSGVKWGSLTVKNFDMAFIALNKIIKSITNEFQVFLAVVAAICTGLIYLLFSEQKEFPFLKITIFINMPVFVMMFSGLRQAIAIAIGILAYFCVRKKKFILFLLCVGLAFLFHKSAIVLILLYPIYYLKIKTYHSLFFAPLFLIVLIFKEKIFNVMLPFINMLFEDKEYKMQEITGAYTTLVLFVLFVILSFVIVDEENIDSETIGLRNILLLSTFLQCFASVHTLAMRINYFFILFIPVVIARVLLKAKKEFEKIVPIINIVLCFFFIVYYLISSNMGADTLEIYPYLPFWEA